MCFMFMATSQYLVRQRNKSARNFSFNTRNMFSNYHDLFSRMISQFSLLRGRAISQEGRETKKRSIVLIAITGSRSTMTQKKFLMFYDFHVKFLMKKKGFIWGIDD